MPAGDDKAINNHQHTPQTITLDGYSSAPGAGNDVIARLPYVNNSQPGTPGGMAGKRDQTAYVFSTSAAITPGKTVQAVTLPAGGSIPAAGGQISGMHIFALGVGPLGAAGLSLSL